MGEAVDATVNGVGDAGHGPGLRTQTTGDPLGDGKFVRIAPLRPLAAVQSPSRPVAFPGQVVTSERPRSSRGLSMARS